MSVETMSEQVILDFVEHLTPEAKHRVATATRWTSRDLVNPSGERCLLGHAFDAKNVPWTHSTRTDRLFLADREAVYTGTDWVLARAGHAFDILVLALGLPVVVAFVKDAAGALK